MKRFSYIGIVFLAWQMVPGGGEIVENAAHLVFAGHTAHGPSDADHQGEEPEHGCSGAFHMCPCHVSPNVTMTASIAVGDVLPFGDTDQLWIEEDMRADAPLSPPFRPPIG